jgi:hypothetical protein
MPQIQDIENPNIPPVDPAWDYATIWVEAWEAKENIENAIRYMGEIENSNTATDEELMSRFERAAERKALATRDRMARAIELIKF